MLLLVNIFDFLNVHPFSPGSFFTFLVDVAHGAAGGSQPGKADWMAKEIFSSVEKLEIANMSIWLPYFLKQFLAWHEMASLLHVAGARNLDD